MGIVAFGCYYCPCTSLYAVVVPVVVEDVAAIVILVVLKFLTLTSSYLLEMCLAHVSIQNEFLLKHVLVVNTSSYYKNYKYFGENSAK